MDDLSTPTVAVKTINNKEEEKKEEKMDTFFPSIEVSNRFQVLAEPDKEVLQSSETKIKPPPIIVKDKKNWPAISQLLRNTNSSSDKNFNDKDRIKMIFSETKTFEKCLQTLGQHKIDHFTFSKKNGSEIRAIFKGVAEEFSVEDITNDLKSEGFHPRVVARFKNRDGSPMPIILCIVPEEDQDIKNLKMIMDINVKFEHQRRRARTSQLKLPEVRPHSLYLQPNTGLPPLFWTA
ncbi:hypothetical protein JTB14_031618 [Gonioctena quinquepunctata]|nr:hypothetical protein JTB14_031618 [Gonioctena quinquepunctata]